MPSSVDGCLATISRRPWWPKPGPAMWEMEAGIFIEYVRAERRRGGSEY